MSQIVYIAPNEKFTMIPNDLLHDKNLTDGAKVLAFYLMSLPKDWQIVWENVAKALNTSIATLRRRKSELMKLGYILLIDNRNTEGKFSQTKLGFKYCNAFDLRKIEAEINIKQSLKNEVEKSQPSDNCEILSTAHLTASGEMSGNNNIIDITKKENSSAQQDEIFILQKTTAFFKTLLEANAKAVSNYKKACNLEEFLNGAELQKAKEWVQWREKMWRIKPIVSVEKLRRAKEKGCDILADLTRCMANDWRGYFSQKDSKTTQSPKKEHKRNLKRAENDEIYTALRAQGWSFSQGDAYKNIRVNGRAIDRENGLFYYV
ncbi:hypothetical protein [Helicobacter sp.]|uniref:hypothetical protein n=1 Tax=Helicobacter sp. TaxID=218 RepID=UPI0025C4521E|nr:hypothetical protein [Helicobacter sp.]MCI5968581.1 hypothetical protein [Helicobacter sp.]